MSATEEQELAWWGQQWQLQWQGRWWQWQWQQRQRQWQRQQLYLFDGPFEPGDL